MIQRMSYTGETTTGVKMSDVTVCVGFNKLIDWLCVQKDKLLLSIRTASLEFILLPCRFSTLNITAAAKPILLSKVSLCLNSLIEVNSKRRDDPQGPTQSNSFARRLRSCVGVEAVYDHLQKGRWIMFRCQIKGRTMAIFYKCGLAYSVMISIPNSGHARGTGVFTSASDLK